MMTQEEVWQFLTTSPAAFKGGGIWKVILTINGSLQAVGLALLRWSLQVK